MSTNRRLLTFAAVLLALYVASDALLRRWPAFWKLALKRADIHQMMALGLEAKLASTPPGRIDIAIFGSSVADADVDTDVVTAELAELRPYVEKLALSASTPLESVMLVSGIERLRPRIVVYPVTLWSLKEQIDWDTVRFYDPVVAFSLFGWHELARDHAEHASGLLEATHTVVRHRDALRRTIGRESPWDREGGEAEPAAMRQADVLERAWKRRRTERDQFVCPTIQTRALALLGRRLTAAGIQLVVIATPVASKWQTDKHVRRLMDECLGTDARQGGYRYVPITEVPLMQARDFRDSVHMSPSGTAKFTAALVKALKASSPTANTAEPDAVR